MTTTTTLYARTPAARPPAPTALARLAALELRKATDTRAGRWLLAIIFVIGAATAGISALAGKPAGHTLSHVLGNASMATSLVLPVLGVMLVTSEWSQRTALTTFTLVPRRDRVIAAKVIAGLLLALAAAIVCGALAVAATAVASHAAGTDPWQAAASLLPDAFVFQALNMLLGIGFGLLFLNTPWPSWCTSRSPPRGRS